MKRPVFLWVWFMDQNLTDDRTTMGSHDDRNSGSVFLVPPERRTRKGAFIQPHARTLLAPNPKVVSGTGATSRSRVPLLTHILVQGSFLLLTYQCTRDLVTYTTRCCSHVLVNVVVNIHAYSVVLVNFMY